MRVLVTGAGGLLGRCTAQALTARGDDVTVLQRRPSGLPCREVLGDVADRRAVRRAVAGQDGVVHLAAKVDVVGPWAEYWRTNVEGTQVVVDACREEGVPRLVHVSSPSVAHSGEPLAGVAAAPADPVRARGHYVRSKAQAELLALGADSPSLAVLAVRPHLVWGPGDPQLVERIVERGRARRLLLVGTGGALMDSTYVDNAADALVAALDVCGCDTAHGEALVVTNGEPRPVGETVRRLCRAAGVPGPVGAVPVPVALGAGAVVDVVWHALGGRDVPPMTRFLAEQLSTAHWFDQRRTREVLRWAPRVSLEEGFERVAAWYRAPR